MRNRAIRRSDRLARGLVEMVDDCVFSTKGDWSRFRERLARQKDAPPLLVYVLTGYLVIGLPLGLWLFWPALSDELPRLEPWKWLLLNVGDLTALAGFVLFGVDRARRRAACEEYGAATPAARSALPFLISVLAALGLDFGMTWWSMAEERRAFGQATIVPAQVVGLEARRHGTLTVYTAACEFRDRAGKVHASKFIVRHEARQGGFPPQVPPVLQARLRGRQVPFGVEMLYDPAWPGRCWMKELGWDDQDRLYWLSLLVLLFQAVALFPAFMITPYWRDLHKIYPLLVEVAILLLFGFIMRIR